MDDLYQKMREIKEKIDSKSKIPTVSLKEEIHDLLRKIYQIDQSIQKDKDDQDEEMDILNWKLNSTIEGL